MEQLLKTALFVVNIRAMHRLKLEVPKNRIATVFSSSPSQVISSTRSHDLARFSIAEQISSASGLYCLCGLTCQKFGGTTNN